MLWVLVVLLSLLWSSLYVEPDVRFYQDTKLAPRLMTGLVMIISPLAILIFANNIRSIRALQFFTWWFIIYGAICMVMWIIKIDPPIFFNLRGQLPVWVSLLVVGQVLFNKDLPFPVRVVLPIIAAGWVYIQFGLGRTWVSGWLPLFGGIGLVIFLYSRKLSMLLLIPLGIYVAANSDLLTRTIEDENQESGITRVEAWDRTLAVVGDHYLLGTGPAGYYFYLQIFIGGRYQLSHNNYVDILAETGVVGFALYIGLWLANGWVVWKTYVTVPKGGFRHALAASLVACYPVTLVVMALGDWVLPFPYTQTLAAISYTIWPWLLVGIAGALYFESRATQRNLPHAI
jgi:O-antigen ligase